MGAGRTDLLDVDDLKRARMLKGVAIDVKEHLDVLALPILARIHLIPQSECIGASANLWGAKAKAYLSTRYNFILHVPLL